MAAINIQRDDFHGDWNYTIKPPRQKPSLKRLLRVRALVRDRPGIVLDVGDQSARRLNQPCQARDYGLCRNESNRKLWGSSGCGSEWGGLDIVGGHGRIQGGEQVMERTVEGSCSRLQEPELPHGFWCSHSPWEPNAPKGSA